MSRFDFSVAASSFKMNQRSWVAQLNGYSALIIDAKAMLQQIVRDYTLTYGDVEVIKYDDEDEPSDATFPENVTAPDAVRASYTPRFAALVMQARVSRKGLIATLSESTTFRSYIDSKSAEGDEPNYEEEAILLINTICGDIESDLKSLATACGISGADIDEAIGE